MDKTIEMRRNTAWRLQFSLRSLILLLLVVSFVAAWLGHRWRQEDRIREAIRLLRVCSKPLSDEFNPVPLVRAVNHLHALGKDDALRAIRRFAESADGIGNCRSESLALDLIIPLLFVPARSNDACPSWTISCDAHYTDLWLEHLRIHVFVQDDLPFLARPSGSRAVRLDKSVLIDWAQSHGRLRAQPLRPTDDPLRAVELLRFRHKHDLMDSFEDQAARSIGHLVSAPPRFVGPTEWERLKAECSRLQVRWSENSQAYVATHQFSIK